MWDAFPQGRFGHIIMSAARRDKHMLTNYRTALDQRAIMPADTSYPHGCLPDTPHTSMRTYVPPILLVRFVDNVYLGIRRVHERSADLPAALVFVQTLLGVVCDIPLKWEKSGHVVDQCEARLVPRPEVACLMNGVTFQHPSTRSSTQFATLGQMG